MRLRKISFRVLLVMVVCCSIVGMANADHWVSSYNWLASERFGSGQGTQYGITFGPPYLVDGTLTYTGNVTNFESTTVCYTPLPYCTYYMTTFSGSLNSGSISFGDVSYAFQGAITSGYFNGSTGFEQLGRYYFVENSYFDFSGRWNNGWTSTGFYEYIGLCCDAGQGYTQMTTTSPEPSTLLMLGSGILGLVGVRRRKLLS